MHATLLYSFFFYNFFCTIEYLASYVFVGGAGHFLWRTGAKYEAYSVALSAAMLYLPVNI